ncbi:MAG: SAM-dependent chlorinase/fluorinase, partial [Chloroflexi bacterium]|nr:SAM-dependent chlorinase/fluorinase [Chloroflexota bacterium]
MSRDWNRPFVSLLTDFGSRDPSGGIMRGVVLAIAPDALIVDISHDVDKFQVADGALLLWCALPYLPIGSHVAVVDPGVGTERRGVALETARGDFLIGPDNGLLLPGAARLGGVVRSHVLDNPQYRLPVVSSSFHGRDLFAPAAAHLASGVPLETLGRPIDPVDLVSLDWAEPTVTDGQLSTRVIYVDTFGNVKLGALGGDLQDAFAPLGPTEPMDLYLGTGGRSLSVGWARTFGDVAVGEPLLYEDSYGRLCLAVNQGSFVDLLPVTAGAEVTIVRPARAAQPAEPPVEPEARTPEPSFAAEVPP